MAYQVVTAVTDICSIVTGMQVNIITVAVALLIASFFACAITDNVATAVTYVVAVTAGITPVAIGRTLVITLTDDVVIAVTETRPIIARILVNNVVIPVTGVCSVTGIIPDDNIVPVTGVIAVTGTIINGNIYPFTGVHPCT
jgi:hypothetical protein